MTEGRRSLTVEKKSVMIKLFGKYLLIHCFLHNSHRKLVTSFCRGNKEINSDTHLPVVSYCPSEVANWWVVVAPALIPICTRARFVLRRNLVSLEIFKICCCNWGLKWCNLGILHKKVFQNLFLLRRKQSEPLYNRTFKKVLEDIEYK